MSENPYEAPKTIQAPAPEKADWLDRIGNWLRWSFRIGLLLILLSAFVHVRSGGPKELILDAGSILGSVLVIISFVGILPLTIWGFIKGYREGRVN